MARPRLDDQGAAPIAETTAPSPGLIKARVLPNNTYSGRKAIYLDGKIVQYDAVSFKAGDIVEVEQSEVDRIPHCLESVAAAKAKQEQAGAERQEQQKTNESLFDKFRAASMEQGKLNAEARRLIEERNKF